MVFVRDRRSEQRHEAVAEELVDSALVAMHLGERQLEEPVEQAMHGLRADASRNRRGVRDVAEHHRDQLALALKGEAIGQHAFREMRRRVGRWTVISTRCRPTLQRRAALAAKLLSKRVVVRATDAADHRRALWSAESTQADAYRSNDDHRVTCGRGAIFPDRAQIVAFDLLPCEQLSV
jgi:hypothetical protein